MVNPRSSKRLSETSKSTPCYAENENSSPIKTYTSKRPRTKTFRLKVGIKPEPEVKREPEVKMEPIEDISYERIIQKNIETRERLFKELNIGKLAQELSNSSGQKKQASNRGLASIKKEKPSQPEPGRKSLRLQRIDAETGLVLPEKEPKKYVVTYEERERQPLTELSIKDVAYWKEDDQLCQMVEEKTKYLSDLASKIDYKKCYDSNKSSFSGNLEKQLAKLKINVDQVAKVTPSRIFSLVVHPSESKLLVAVGDKWGALGLWDVKNTQDEKDGVQYFYPHSRPINCLSVDTFESNKLISTSYDGTVRSFDLESQKVDLIYGVDEDDFTYTGYHHQMDAKTFLISLGRTGLVGLVDTRVSTFKRVRDYQVYDRVSARMAALHPIKKHLLIAPNSKGDCGIFDIRTRTKSMSPVMSLMGHTRSMTSAMFSPITGNTVATVCFDNRVRIYDISKEGKEIKPIKQIAHNNQTGQWLTTFKAEWHPRLDDVFMVGSMNSPRQMDIFKSSGELLPIRGEELTSICSVVKVHPTQDVIVGGNSSGRVFVFM